MSLHEALRDAESGKAQHLQGNSLDTLLDENNRPLNSSEAAKLDLDEGEILKLPPTPEMTDGTEYQSDPETNKVHSLSRPGSGTTTPNSATKRRVPPPPPALPPRSSAGAAAVVGSTGLRPPLDRNDSSASHYSDAIDGDRAGGASLPPTTQSGTSGIPADGPPDYADHAGAGAGAGSVVPAAYPAEKTESAIPAYDQSSAPSGYPAEKGASGQAEPAPGYDYDHASAAPMDPPYAETGEMDESERREWEQFHADQELAQRAGQLDLNQGQAGARDESLR